MDLFFCPFVCRVYEWQAVYFPPAGTNAFEPAAAAAK
jgi:hypothetical protein